MCLALAKIHNLINLFYCRYQVIPRIINLLGEKHEAFRQFFVRKVSTYLNKLVQQRQDKQN